MLLNLSRAEIYKLKNKTIIVNKNKFIRSELPQLDVRGNMLIFNNSEMYFYKNTLIISDKNHYIGVQRPIIYDNISEAILRRILEVR